MRVSAQQKRIESEAAHMRTWQKINRIEDLFKEVRKESAAAAQTTIIKLQQIAARPVRGANVG